MNAILLYFCERNIYLNIAFIFLLYVYFSVAAFLRLSFHAMPPHYNNKPNNPLILIWPLGGLEGIILYLDYLVRVQALGNYFLHPSASRNYNINKRLANIIHIIFTFIVYWRPFIILISYKFLHYFSLIEWTPIEYYYYFMPSKVTE